MLPSGTVPPSLLRLLNHFWPCFTRPTFATFAALVTGVVAHGGPHTVCGMLVGSGLARLWPHDRAHGFFSYRRWDVGRVGETMARLVVASFTAPGQAVTLAVDDTVVKRAGRSVFGCFRQHDGATRDPMGLSWGVCFVVTAVVVRVAGRSRALALPTLACCWRPARTPAGQASSTAQTARGVERARERYERALGGLRMRQAKENALPAGHRLPGTDPTPALIQRLQERERDLAAAWATHHTTLGRVLARARTTTTDTATARPTKTEIALALAAHQARLFADRMVHVVADAAYHSPALRVLPDNMTWTMRLMSTAVIYAPPEEPPQGSPTRPGRPRINGDRLGTPAHIAATTSFTHTTTTSGPHTIADLDCRWPSSLGRTPLRLILVSQAHHPEPYDLALLTTDMTSPAATIIDRYAHRWPIETCFQDTRTHLGLEHAQNRTRTAVERTVPLQLLTYSLTVLWYHHHGTPTTDTAQRRRAHPWYTTKTEPAFADMRTALHRAILDHRISTRVSDQGLRQTIREIILGDIDTAA